MTRSAPHPWHGAVEPGTPTLVVGVLPNQSPAVVRGAASLAHAMRASLVCVWADPARSFVAEEPDGTLVTTPLDPDHADSQAGDGVAETALSKQLAADLAGVDVPWRFVYTVGEASRALARVARESGALLIVIGSRRPGIGGWMNHLIGGSTAGHLAHTQSVPVTIVPLSSGDHP
ncbi:universal stress protein [Cellulomonas humilata]|uniref:Nucleotide-binding universal stress UspA family protein n=1 Tax=Cellulomonas humilata TaxID=144055 RepID=A0ABU0EJL8_9CELL|nr:universal stress protein [Cellulomonas humilata]MDQ0375478.1 nucleotide-binding universal stress UspA family protein [Cellulomonas humilata]